MMKNRRTRLHEEKMQRLEAMSAGFIDISSLIDGDHPSPPKFQQQARFATRSTTTSTVAKKILMAKLTPDRENPRAHHWKTRTHH
jgi:hypothetical protein